MKNTMIERMAIGYDNNIENVKEPVISREERKVILNKIAKVVSYKNTTGEDIVNYVSHLAEGIKLISA